MVCPRCRENEGANASTGRSSIDNEQDEERVSPEVNNLSLSLSFTNIYMCILSEEISHHYLLSIRDMFTRSAQRGLFLNLLTAFVYA